MKRKYNAPVAEMMEFDYEENVVASLTTPANGEYHFSGNPWYGEKGANKPGCIKREHC